MKYLQYIFSLLFFCMLNAAYAQSAADELSKQLDAVHSMRASFVQTVYDNKNKPIQQSYGRMALLRPGKFRWEVDKPIPQVIIANQTRLWIYDPDLEQVTIRPLKNAAGETPALLLSHTNMALETEFNVREMASHTSGWRWFSLQPKNADNVFSHIDMGFSQGQIHEMRLQDHLGHMTRIQFQKIAVNINLSPNIFIFKAPKSVDVINETR